MKILSCEIRPLGDSTSHKVPATFILDSGANCNIIGESIAKIVGLKIDNTSDIEIYGPISELNILGIIRAMEISVLSQDRKWEQVKVTMFSLPINPNLNLYLYWVSHGSRKMQ